MEKKNSKSSMITIVILAILVIALGGYIVYDKIISSKNIETNTENTNGTDNSVEVEEEVKNTISESEALSIGNELWEYAYSTFWGIEPAWISHVGDTDQYGGRPIICDSTIEQVKQKFTYDFKAQSCYSDDDSTCTDYTINTIPQTTCQSAGRGALQDYKDTNLTIKDIQDDEIVFTATSTYCSSSFCLESNDIAREIQKDFVIKKENDNWLIANFYLPD